jgi:dimethylargininase
MLAITHLPSPKMEHGERTFIGRDPIDFQLALRQHAEYHRLLLLCGASVQTLVVNSHLADCAFIEDTAVVLDEVAILCSMGTPSRLAEPMPIHAELGKHRRAIPIEPPATLEGGDVLRVGKTLLVGRSSRTNSAGIEALDAITRPLGYRVVAIPVHACLHLKTACCALPDGRLLVNPSWIDLKPLTDFKQIEVPPDEPFGANILLVQDHIIIEATNARTTALIREFGFQVHPINLSEFAKAEAGVTCLSLLIASPDSVNRM